MAGKGWRRRQWILDEMALRRYTSEKEGEGGRVNLSR